MQQKEVIGYLCLECGKRKGDHKAKIFNCPYPSRSKNFANFNETKFYTPDFESPVYGVTL